MPKPKSQAQKGLEKILNDPRVSPFSNPQGFRAVIDGANLPLAEVFKHVGSKKAAAKPKDDDKSKARIERLEEESQEH